MDYEQKYKEALKKAKKEWSSNLDNAYKNYRERLEIIFPELKESEDERIRKEIIDFLWKEKIFLQEAHSSVENNPKYRFVMDAIAWLEKQGIQPTDKLEPKFKVGDWIILPLGIIAHIESLNSTDYQVTTTDGKICDFKISKQDNYHLWAITDARDGDVLSINWHEGDDSWEKIIIFKKYHNKGVKGIYSMPCVEGYGNTFKNGKLAFQEEIPHYSETWTANLHPATKEQRDTLMKAMDDAGWEFDFEKKELKRIEHKMLDTDKVIEWLYDQACQGWIEDVEVDKFVDQFKEDFGLSYERDKNSKTTQ